MRTHGLSGSVNPGRIQQRALALALARQAEPRMWLLGFEARAVHLHRWAGLSKRDAGRLCHLTRTKRRQEQSVARREARSDRRAARRHRLEDYRESWRARLAARLGRDALGV
jgi:hypothetical protein